jgi:hypothetical protein
MVRDLPKEEQGILEGRNALLFNALTVLGVMVLSSFYMLSSPDTWFRMSHALYDRPDACSGSRRETPLADKPQRRLLFVFIGIGFAPIALLGVLLGSYGNWLGDLPPEIAEGFRQEAFWNLGSVYTLGQIIDNDTIVGPLFALALLVVFSLACMSTIDTALITAAQLHRDRHFRREKRTNGPSLEETKRFMKYFFLIAAAIPLASLMFLDTETFVFLSSVLGFFMVFFSANTFFVFMSRVIRKNWRPKGWRAVVMFYGVPIGLSLVFVIGLNKSLDKFEAVPWNHPFTATGPNAIVFVLVYGAVFLFGMRVFSEERKWRKRGKAGTEKAVKQGATSEATAAPANADAGGLAASVRGK